MTGLTSHCSPWDARTGVVTPENVRRHRKSRSRFLYELASRSIQACGVVIVPHFGKRPIYEIDRGRLCLLLKSMVDAGESGTWFCRVLSYIASRHRPSYGPVQITLKQYGTLRKIGRERAAGGSHVGKMTPLTNPNNRGETRTLWSHAETTR